MGNWNRRYLPRKKFRHCEYEDPPLSPPGPHNNQSYSSGVADSRMSSWEIDYCKSIKVPWNRVVASKKYIYCYPTVLNWDASAAKEALNDAKKRFWAVLNDLPCDNPLPDPDLYIDEIDWNPYMDPELMAELDLPVFDPDKPQKGEKSEAINEWVDCAQTQDDKNQYTSGNQWGRNNTYGAGSAKDTSDNPGEGNNMQGAGSLKDASDNPWEGNDTQGPGSSKDTGDNPWERNNTQGAGSSKDLQGWDRWNDSINLKNGDPWEQSWGNPVDSLKDNTWRSGNGNDWRSGNESWGWKKGGDNSKSSHFTDYRCGNSWNFNEQNMAAKQEGWGRDRGCKWGQRENNSWGLSAAYMKAEGERNLVNYGYSFENNYSTGPKERGWRDKRNTEYQGNEPKYWDSQTSGRGGRSFRGGGRKREGSLQHTSKYKSFKCQGDAYGRSHQW